MSDDPLDLETLSLSEIVGQINPQTYQSLKTALELGKWSDGRRLSKDQLGHCMQAVILYEAEHLQERHRVGYINRPTSAGKSCGSK